MILFSKIETVLLIGILKKLILNYPKMVFSFLLI